MRLMEIENHIVAYHGSPYLFDRFTNRYGSGVGGNALGHGIYFTEINIRALSYGRMAADDNFNKHLLNKILFKKSKGTVYYLYTVELLVDPQKLINYSVQMQQQTPHVLKALGEIEKEIGIDFSQEKGIEHPDYPSWKIVNQLRLHLKGATLASNMLSKHDIQGIKLQIDSKETQYIIFDPQRVRIIKTDQHKL